MKRLSIILIVVLIAISVFLVPNSKPVNAWTNPASPTPNPLLPTATPAPVETIAEDSWTAGEEFYIDEKANPSPASWLQLLSKGTVISEPLKLCHPFRGGRFNWVADIRQLVDGKWVKVPTTVEWLTTDEGPLMVCTDAKSAGTFALFGFYTEKK